MISLLVVLLFVMGAGVTLSLAFSDEITGLLIRELNKKIVTEIEVKEIRFSLLRKFPNASIELRQVLIHPPSAFHEESRANPGYDTLLFAKHLFLEFHTKDVIQKRFRIKRIHADKGSLYLKVNRDGVPNYQFWGQDTNAAGDTMNINLQDLKFSDLQVMVINQVNDFRFSSLSESIRLRGDFASSNFQLQVAGNPFVQYLSLDGIQYITERACRIDLQMSVDGKQYTIGKGNIEISGMPFVTHGSFTTDDNRKLNLMINGEDLDLASVIRHLPATQKERFSNYAMTGKLDFNVALTGNYGQKGSPLIVAKGALVDASLAAIDDNVRIDKLNLAGYYSNGLKKAPSSTSLNVDEFSCAFGNNELSGSFTIENFETPKMELLLTGSLDLSEMRNFVQMDTVEFMTGAVRINLRLEGPLKHYKQITRQDIQNMNPVGQVVLRDAGIKMKNDSKLFTDVNGTLMFGKHIWVDELDMDINGNRLTLTGKLGNAIPYLLTGDKPLLVDADITAAEFILDRIVSREVSQTDSLQSRSEIHFPENLQMNLRLNIKEYYHRQFYAQNLSGILSIRPGIIALQSIVFDTMEGHVSGDGMLAKAADGTYPVRVQSNIKQLNIQKLFTTFNNFGQEYIIDKNLKGSASGEIDFSATWDRNVRIDKKSIVAESHVIITRGELIDFEPMMGLSKFIEVEELQHIHFSELENEILIKDEKITIPQMEIHSSALNVTLSGEHDFDNNISYKTRVLLSEILFRKAKNRKQENEEFGVIEDDGLGKTSLYLTLTGTPGDINITYDRKGVRQVISESIQEERKELRQMLKEEFGWFKKDSIGVADESERQKDTRFIIQWDDQDTVLTDTLRRDTVTQPTFRIEWDDEAPDIDTTDRKKQPFAESLMKYELR